MAVWVLVALLFSAMTAEWIGIHAIFGAFLLGAIIPHDSDVARDFTQQAGRHRQDSAAAGVLRLHRHADARSAWCRGWEAWLFCAVIILVATLGKFGGTLRGGPVHRARAGGCRPRWAFS